MLVDDEKKLILEALIKCEAVKFGDFTLASGRKSKYYIDIKKASTEPNTLSLIAAFINSIIKVRTIDLIGGVALGGVPLATAVSLKSKLPLLIIRKEDKGYGTGGSFIGDLKQGAHVILVEDVTTTGGSVLKAISTVSNAGGIIDSVITVVDRDEGAKEVFLDLGIEFISLVSASDILKNEHKDNIFS